MTSPSHSALDDPVREWTDAAGEEWVAMHPLYAAIFETWVPKSVRGAEAMRMLSRLVQEIVRGERRFPDSLAERVLELDAEQRANGCPNYNLGNLLRERHGPAAA